VPLREFSSARKRRESSVPMNVCGDLGARTQNQPNDASNSDARTIDNTTRESKGKR
jgi:hypothetical protein